VCLTRLWTLFLLEPCWKFPQVVASSLTKIRRTRPTYTRQQQPQSRVHCGNLHTPTTTKTRPKTQQQPHKLPDRNAQVVFEPVKQYVANVSLRGAGNANSGVHVPFGMYCDTHAHMQHTARSHEDVHSFKRTHTHAHNVNMHSLLLSR